MKTNLSKLTQYKEDLEQAKIEKSKAEGKLEELFNTLEKEFGAVSIKEAESILEDLEKKKRKVGKLLEKKVSELEQIDWN